MANDSEKGATLDGWSAGQIRPCEGGDEHRPEGIHVVVRCSCGAAYMSTDGRVALTMAHFEPPQQALWLTTPEHGVGFQAPVLVADRKKEGW